MKRSLAAVSGLLLLAGALHLLGGAGHAQNFASSHYSRYFRVEAQPGTTRAGRPILYGWVNNDYGLLALDVRLLAEAVDASGVVIDKTSGYVNHDIPAFGRSYFEMPAPAGGASYRVTVSYVFFRQGGGGA
jgi:hypothetical protein